jgi:hypothetical protein
LIEPGVSLNWILTDLLKITFIDISHIYLHTFENYMLFQLSPYFKIAQFHKQVVGLLDRDYTKLLNKDINASSQLDKFEFSFEEWVDKLGSQEL